jgi:hypothetical protein
MTHTDDTIMCYTRKELLQLHASDNPPPLKCQAHTIHNSMCNNSPKWHITNLNLWKCGIHLTPPQVKNGLRQRQTSFNYAISVTLHNSNDSKDTSVPLCNELGDNMCFYCNSKMNKCSLDHIKPVIHNRSPSRYMITSNYNKVMCCEKCNSSKGSNDVIQWMITRQYSQDKIAKVTDRIQNIPNHSESFMEKVINDKFEITSNAHKLFVQWNEKPNNSKEDKADICSKMAKLFSPKMTRRFSI